MKMKCLLQMSKQETVDLWMKVLVMKMGRRERDEDVLQ